ncbi:MAG: hypothetical protein ACRC33_00280 [Gemmataceae bacterium]
MAATTATSPPRCRPAVTAESGPGDRHDRTASYRYPPPLGLASLAWILAGWAIAVTVPAHTLDPFVAVLSAVLPAVTAGLIVVNLYSALLALFRRRVAVERLLLITGLQVGLFTTLFHQIAAHHGAEHYWSDGAADGWGWVQFSAAHAMRASDVIDAVEAFGLKLQAVRHRSVPVAVVVVVYHVVIDVFLLGLLWQLLGQARNRLAGTSWGRLTRPVGVGLFLATAAAWALFALRPRPWDPKDIPLWFGENAVRVLDFADIMDSFEVHWHQVPRGPVENTLTFACRLWFAVGFSALVGWWRGPSPAEVTPRFE